MKALILAAGLGTRLLPYTEHTPKPLFPVGGRPLIDIIIRKLEAAGCEAIIINIHHLYQKIDDFISSQKYLIPVFTRYEPLILGTGGAIKNVADFLDNKPFIVINSDILTDINLQEVYSFHLEHNGCVTLVLIDFEKFNNVFVSQDNLVLGFEQQQRENSLQPVCGQDYNTRLAFTGIQVIDPEIIDLIPENKFSHSIDVYRQIIADGKQIHAYIPDKLCWNDLGTPEAYKEAVIEETAPKAFKVAFGDYRKQEIKTINLAGDGSDRKWFRLISGQYSLIMADHGIRREISNTEVDSFIQIGNHLNSKGLPLPRIYLHDAFSGLVFVEDLGDVNLQAVIINATSQSEIINWYRSIIDQLIELSISGGFDFDTSWTYQTSNYSIELIMQKECGYFTDAFLKGYLNLNIDFDKLENEFMKIAFRALDNQFEGFMHRDMQSRNIMIKDGSIYFIDFQGGRIGPLQYDLASLINDPYVALPYKIRMELIEYCMTKLLRIAGINENKFYNCYKYCSITRNLQILGAFGFLSKVKKKTFFEKYIPAALSGLKENFKLLDGKEFPGIKYLIDNIL
ncbi:MAG: phosphotransferase [Proteobacteria bacterium]|nr:phosphotransferase [Pseudomonadota bacterium]